MNRRLTAWGMCVVLLATILLSVSAAAQTGTVRAILVQGNARTPDATILSTIHTRVGAPFDSTLVRQDIKDLYKLNQFSDVSVQVDTRPDGLVLIYNVVETPVIASVGFTGNRKIKTKDLQEDVTIKTYRPLDEADVATSIEKIRQAYAKKGYYLVDIDYHLETTDKNETKLVFDILENHQVIVRRVYFLGNKAFSDDQLRDVVHTKQKGALSFITSSGKYDEDKLRLDKMLLTYHYLNHGYMKVKVGPPNVTISKDRRYIFITFSVEEGKQYRISETDIVGDILTTKEELQKALKTKKGDLYSQENLERDIQMLQDRYGDEGYAFANIVPQTVPDDATLTAKVIFQIDKGDRITIERINIYGNTKTRDKVIRREMLVYENDRYSERRLRESRARLMALGFFEEVNFATPRGSQDDTVVLNVTVKEKPTGSFNVGAGFSSVEDFIFNASVQKDNFLGYGISGSVGMELSRRRQFFNLSFQDPYFLDTDWIFGASVYRNAYLFSDFRRTAMGGTMTFGRRIFKIWSFDVGYQVEEVSVSDFSFAVPQVFRINSSGLTSAVNLSLSRDTRDNRLMPNRGTFNIVNNELSGAKLGGQNDFYRVNYRSMYYRPIWKGVGLRAFGRIGYIDSLNTDPVPLYERFFMGGPNSLRGYFPNSIGPTLRIPANAAGGEQTFVYGGNKMLQFVGELELPLYNDAGLKIVGFYDAGNAFAEEQNYSLTGLRQDYGFGLRWNSPMGPLRFEWGIPIDRQPGESSVVFNFGIGSFF